MIRKNIYRWHRIASMIIALPVLLWAVSGFMHPLMTTIKPAVATQSLKSEAIDPGTCKTALQQALQENKISTIHNVRMIHIDTNYFYQVQETAGGIPVYLSTTNGKKLRNGDSLYAQYIAKQFLEGQPAPVKKTVQYASVNVAHSEHEGHGVEAEEPSGHDCCDAATACIMLAKGSRASATTRVTDFTEEYKSINRLLPVYKVDFNRADGIRLYVETTQDRFAFAMDNRRAVFDTFFSWFHTWQWLNGAGPIKYVLMVLITALAVFTTIMGLYIFAITKTKKSNQPLGKARRNHRYVSLIASVFTLMFTFSGGLHAWEKLQAEPPVPPTIRYALPAASAQLDLATLQTSFGPTPIHNISLAQIDTVYYWRVLVEQAGKATTAASYVRVHDQQPLPDGEVKYAQYLAGVFSGHPESAIQQTTLITKFAGEYGFVNKRLPVWKVGYALNNHERYYVETSTAQPAAYVTDNDLFEGYSFALLHKHHFMDWGGKITRDVSTMIAAALQIAMVVFGLILVTRWWRKTRQNRQRTDPPVDGV